MNTQTFVMDNYYHCKNPKTGLFHVCLYRERSHILMAICETAEQAYWKAIYFANGGKTNLKEQVA